MKHSPFTDLYEAASHLVNTGGAGAACQLHLVLERYQDHEELDPRIPVIGTMGTPEDHELFTRIWERRHGKNFFSRTMKFFSTFTRKGATLSPVTKP